MHNNNSKKLIEILGITKPTFKRLNELGIILQYEFPVRNISIDGQAVKYKNRSGWLSYYNLNDIRMKLNTYIKNR